MTKRDFVALAAKLRAAKPEYAGDRDSMDYAFHGVAYAQWTLCVRGVLEACQSTNPKFSRGKFIAACGVPNLLDK